MQAVSDVTIRPGEIAGPLPESFDAGLYFIGRIRTPWRTRVECPRRGDYEGPICRIEIDPRWRPALTGLAAFDFLQILYFMDRARRDLLLQTPKGRDPVGTFAVRSPVRPNPIASSIVKLEAVEAEALVVRGLDCMDGTPLIDIKPHLKTGLLRRTYHFDPLVSILLTNGRDHRTTMLDRLKSFFDDLTGGGQQSAFAPDDYRVAAAALLVHMANADGYVAPQEQRRLHKILEQRFELTSGDARELLRRAEESEREAVDLYQFTSVLKRALDEPGRIAVVELLWDVAFADGKADELEENTVWRIAELLGVSSRDRMLLKRKAEKGGPEPLPENPWENDGSGV